MGNILAFRLNGPSVDEEISCPRWTDISEVRLAFEELRSRFSALQNSKLMPADLHAALIDAIRLLEPALDKMDKMIGALDQQDVRAGLSEKIEDARLSLLSAQRQIVLFEGLTHG